MAIMLEQYSSQGLKTNKAKDQECIRFDVVVVVVIVVGTLIERNQGWEGSPSSSMMVESRLTLIFLKGGVDIFLGVPRN